MYQLITLIGNIGNDPESRKTPNGVTVASFRMAVNKIWTGQDGQKQEKSTWFRVSCWEKQAEFVSLYLGKGRQVMVVGEVEEARGYIDKQGNPAATIEVTARVVKALGPRPPDEGQPATQATQAHKQLAEIDIPF